MVTVEIQDSHGHFANLRQRVDDRAVQFEVIRPTIGSRVEEANQLARRPIDRAEIASFVSIARLAREGKVAALCCAAVLDADDVINFAT